jgi:hypothetical protein
MRFLVPVVLGCVAPLSAQSLSWPPSVPISTPEALAHRLGHDKPVYPAFALAAGITSTLKVPVSIWQDGTVHIEGALNGPPTLIASAQTWLNFSKFRPFLRDGQPVNVTTTLPVVFTLPPGAHSAHPPAVLYQRNINTSIEREGPDSPPRARWSTISPSMRDWLARYQVAIATFDDSLPTSTNMLPFDRALARGAAPPIKQMPGNIALYPIQLAVPRHHLYLLFEFSHGCTKSNCPIFLLDESPAGVSLAIRKLGVDVDLHRRHDSPYPDVLIWSDTGQQGISTISGYGYYGGEWGQLYCGTDDAAEDSERDEAIADRRGAHITQPPLVTLCK